MTGFRLAAAGVLLMCMLAACASPAPVVPAGPKRSAATYTFYLPRVAGSALPFRLYLPRTARQSPWRQYLPVINNKYPACASFGGDCGEPNDSRALAFGVSEFNRPYYGAVYTATADAYDYFSANLLSGIRYSITLSGGQAPGSPFAGQGDADLYLYDPAGMPLAKSDVYGQSAETILFTPATSGRYYVLAYAFHTPVMPAKYRLEVRDVP